MLFCNEISLGISKRRLAVIIRVLACLVLRNFGAFFTKYADISADYKGKLLKSFDGGEDSAQNPASLGDNFGDIIEDSFGYVLLAIVLSASIDFQTILHQTLKPVFVDARDRSFNHPPFIFFFSSLEL